MALSKYAAPSVQKVRLPTVPVTVGSYTSYEPKPTGANYYTPKSYYTAPASSGLPKPYTVTPQSPFAPVDTSAYQATAPPDVNYDQLLADDPTLAEQIRAINEQQAADKIANTNLQNRGMIQFGGVPTFTGPTSSLIGDLNVDPETLRLAQEATAGGVSTMAVRDKSLSDARQSYLASEAARGMIRSGATGQHENEVLASYQQGSYQDRQELADYLISLHQDWLGHVSQGNSAKAQATKEALDRIILQVSQQEAARQAENAQKARDLAAAQAKQAADDAAYQQSLITNGYGTANVGNPYADFTFTNDPSYPQIGASNTGGGGGAAAPPNVLQTVGSDAAQAGAQYGPWTKEGYDTKPWWWDNYEQWGWQQESPPPPGTSDLGIGEAAADYTYAPGSSPVPGEGSYFQSQLGNYGKKPLW